MPNRLTADRILSDLPRIVSTLERVAARSAAQHRELPAAPEPNATRTPTETIQNNTPTTPLVDPSGRRVTVYGTFARAARDGPASFPHTNFYVVDDHGHPPISTCRVCATLLHVPRRPLIDILAEIDALDPLPGTA